MPETFLDRIDLHCGDCLAVLATLPDNSIDSCVTDPPYHLTSIVKRFGSTSEADDTITSQRIRDRADGYARLMAGGFMGKVWDGGDIAFRPETWRAVFRVLKPGGYVLAFGGTRTYHRMACAIEDAGFDVRDMISWIYGSGFPKSHDVSKGIDRAAGAEREIIRERYTTKRFKPGATVVAEGEWGKQDLPYTATDSEPSTDAARQWDGWGTALKPALEPLCVGMKPLTLQQTFSIILTELWGRIWLSSNASDAGINFQDTQATLIAAANSVPEHVKISVLAKFDPARFVAPSSIFNSARSDDLIRTRENSAQENVRQDGSVASTSEQTIRHGEAAVSKLMAIFTSAITDGMSPNIASSWLNISEGILIEANKFTIETVSRLIIALKTWSCFLAPSTSEDIGNLFPDLEPICMARKPLSEGTVAANVLEHGTGAINVDACRVEARDGVPIYTYRGEDSAGIYGDGLFGSNRIGETSHRGRWPANVIHDGSEEVVGMFPSDAGASAKASGPTLTGSNQSVAFGRRNGTDSEPAFYSDSGSAARFFYSAKADADDRLGSKHPTVKPVDLMQYLVRLITPPHGTVIDPFAGTGTTGEAAWREGMHAVLIEAESEYQNDIRRRMKLCMAGPDERAREAMKAKLEGKPRDDGPLFNRESWSEMWQRPFDFSQEPKGNPG